MDGSLINTIVIGLAIYVGITAVIALVLDLLYVHNKLIAVFWPIWLLLAILYFTLVILILIISLFAKLILIIFGINHKKRVKNMSTITKCIYCGSKNIEISVESKGYGSGDPNTLYDCTNCGNSFDAEQAFEASEREKLIDEP